MLQGSFHQTTTRSTSTRCPICRMLASRNPDRYSIRPKLHLFLEMAIEGHCPSLSWCYREDFGGSLAHLAVRRGGRDTTHACSANILDHFRLHWDVPALRYHDSRGQQASLLRIRFDCQAGRVASYLFLAPHPTRQL